MIKWLFFQVVTNFKCSVNALCVCGMQLWVGTAGQGIYVYDALEPKNILIAVWNQAEGMCINC